MNEESRPKAAPQTPAKASTTSVAQSIPDGEQARVLAPEEAQRLAALERVVDAGLNTFVAVGNALGEISTSKLYQATNATFDEYTRERFGIGRSRVYQLMAAATITESLSTAVDITTERQARELVGLAPEVAKTVFVAATSAADQRGAPAPTGDDLRDARAAITSVAMPSPAPSRPSRRRALPDAYDRTVYDLQKVLERLKRLHDDDRFATNRPALKQRYSNRISNLEALLSSASSDLDGHVCSECDKRVPVNADYLTNHKDCS